MPEIPPALAPVVEALDETGWAAEITGPDWIVLWASTEMRTILRVEDSEDGLGVGEHLLSVRRARPLERITDDSRATWMRLHAPFAMYDTGATAEDLLKVVPEGYADVLAHARPRRPPPRWCMTLDMGAGLGRVRCLGERIVDEDGTLLGNAFIYGSALPASILAFVARGNRLQFTRMARLVEPGRRPAAILFADVEGSTDRSRRLPSARYFALIRELTTAVDDAILEQGGIVGKHAGDGVSAFFLAEQAGSISRAARGALVAADAIRGAATALDGDWRVNIGVHWGATLYMGQVVTSGRLEVTALGDEVNECARIQEAAHGGELLASKALLERLDEADARALHIDPETIVYRLVRELPSAGEKARRDAGSLPVASF